MPTTPQQRLVAATAAAVLGGVVLFYRYWRKHWPRKDPTESPSVQLNSGRSMPLLGLGTWRAQPGEAEEAVKEAICAGYRHIDCAYAYENEKQVGAGIHAAMAETNVRREDLFIVSKLWNTFHRPQDVLGACRRTLQDLGLDYLDLYLMHWPIAFVPGNELFPTQRDGSIAYDDTPFTATWKAMETLVDMGLVKSIGLSNFNSKQIDAVIAVARIRPAVLQVECHPLLPQERLIAHCRERRIHVTAFSPLGSPHRPWVQEGEPRLMENATVIAIAKKHKITCAQVLIRFQIQRGVAVIPKSSSPLRIRSNLLAGAAQPEKVPGGFRLDDDDMQQLLALGKRSHRFCVPRIDVDGQLVPRDAAHPFYPFNEPF